MSVRCYENDKVIGLVAYTSNMDYWDGHNWTCGSSGRHLGIGKTKDGRYYVCYGTQWQGERDHAEIITKEEARQLCLEHNPDKYEVLFGEEPPMLTANL